MSTNERMMSEYPVRARDAVEPNANAPMPFRVSRTGRVVDVIGLPPNVAVVQARLGRLRYSREEMKSSFAEFLALDGEEVKAGTYCVFTVANLGSKPVAVAGKVIVEGEHGEAVEGLPLYEVTDGAGEGSAPSSSSHGNGDKGGKGGKAVNATREREGEPRRNAANDAMVDAIIDNATMADGTPMTKAKPLKSKLRSSRTATSPAPVKATGRRPMPTPTTSPMPRAAKPQKVMTSHARRQRYEAQAAAAAAAGASGATERTRAVLLHVGHVAMLEMALTACVPLGESDRGEIGAAIRDARDGVTRDVGVGVVAVHFSDADLERLEDAIYARAEYAIDDVASMCAAISAAVGGSSNERGRVRPERSESEALVSVSPLPPAPVDPKLAAEPEAPRAIHTAVAPAETADVDGAEAAPPSAPVEKAEVGNVTSIATSGRMRPREERGESLDEASAASVK